VRLSLDALFPKTRQGILAAALVRPDKTFASELAWRMGVAPSSLADLPLPLRRARELLGREINPTVYAPAEFAKKLAVKDHLLAQVSAKPKLNVLGSEDELAKATGK
jgi:hypothetical protein